MLHSNFLLSVSLNICLLISCFDMISDEIILSRREGRLEGSNGVK